MPSREKILQQLVETALNEDVGVGDITTLATTPSDRTGVGEIIAKSEGILCGLPLCEYAFLTIDPKLEFKFLIEEGQAFASGDRIALIMGRLQSILTAERTALNFLMHLSGIATLTNTMVTAAGTNKVKLLDTRKTNPGLRYVEKYAVATGGGENHRFGLYDMVLIKDNHLMAAGSVSNAIDAVRSYLSSEEFLKRFHTDPAMVDIEVEVESEEQLGEALDAGIKRVLLDNRSPEHLKKMVALTREHAHGHDVLLEASGNVTLNTIADVAATGVDYISIGALTHSAPAADFSLKILEDE